MFCKVSKFYTQSHHPYSMIAHNFGLHLSTNSLCFTNRVILMDWLLISLVQHLLIPTNLWCPKPIIQTFVHGLYSSSAHPLVLWHTWISCSLCYPWPTFVSLLYQHFLSPHKFHTIWSPQETLYIPTIISFLNILTASRHLKCLLIAYNSITISSNAGQLPYWPR